jgi:putative transcriptional regulator
MRERDFNDLVPSIKQAGRIRRGKARPSRVFVFKPADIKAVRLSLGKSQIEFAMIIGVSVATLRDWEHGRRTPDGPAMALLRVAAKNPKAVAAALGSEPCIGPRPTSACGKQGPARGQPRPSGTKRPAQAADAQR